MSPSHPQKIKVLIVISFIASVVIYCSSLRSNSATPTPQGSSDFAIGFDLNPGYAAVSVNFANGTTIDIGKRLGTPDYLEAMRRLSLPESRHPAPPYNEVGDSVTDLPRQGKRQALKALGMPASYEVGAFSEMIHELMPAVKSVLDAPIQSAVVTIPQLPGLYHEDIVDLFTYLGLRELPLPSLRIGNQRELVYHTTAALAGNGIGLCEHFSDEARCNGELNDSHASGVSYSVAYYDNALMVSSARYSGAYSLSMDTALIDRDLGSGRASKGDDYWAAVRVLLASIEPRFLVGDGPLQVQLFGDEEGVRDRRMARSIRDVLSEQVGSAPEIHMQDPEFVCARGAAVLARQFASRLDRDEHSRQPLEAGL